MFSYKCWFARNTKLLTVTGASFGKRSAVISPSVVLMTAEYCLFTSIVIAGGLFHCPTFAVPPVVTVAAGAAAAVGTGAAVATGVGVAALAHAATATVTTNAINPRIAPTAGDGCRNLSLTAPTTYVKNISTIIVDGRQARQLRTGRPEAS